MNYKKYLNYQLIFNLLIVSTSFLFYFLWYIYSPERTIVFLNLNISIGHIGYLGLLIIPAFLIKNNLFLQKIWLFFSGLVILDLFSLVYIVNNREVDIDNYFNNIILIVFLLFISILYGIDWSTNKLTENKNPKMIIVFFSSLIFMFIYHASNYYLKVVQHVANEDRSVFINGLEFHHINYGIVLLVLVPFFFKYVPRLPAKLVTLGYVFIGFIYGTVFDEAYYYMLKDVSDEAYLYPSVIMIQVLMMMFSFGSWFYLLKNKKVLNA